MLKPGINIKNLYISQDVQELINYSDLIYRQYRRCTLSENKSNVKIVGVIMFSYWPGLFGSKSLAHYKIEAYCPTIFNLLDLGNFPKNPQVLDYDGKFSGEMNRFFLK